MGKISKDVYVLKRKDGKYVAPGSCSLFVRFVKNFRDNHFNLKAFDFDSPGQAIEFAECYCLTDCVPVLTDM